MHPDQFKPLRVLLVEPNPQARVLLDQLLGAASYEVETARSSAEARELAMSMDALDLVVAPGELPDGDGVQLMSELHDLYGCRTICLVGGAAENDDCGARCAQAGIDRCVPRPRTFEHLRLAVSILAPRGRSAAN